MPVVEVDDVDRSAVGAQCLERRPAEQPEAPRVVRVVTADRVAVVAGPIERRRVVHEPEAIAVADDVDDRHFGRAGRRDRVGNADPPPRRLAVGQGHRPVAREEHVDRRLGPAVRPAECPGERVHDVTETAGLGPRLALGGDERDAHGGMVAGPPGRGRYDARRWSRSSTSRRCPASPSGSLPSSTACAASPTTCGGRGIPARVPCSAGSTARPGRATATRSRCSRGRSAGPRRSRTRTCWPNTSRSSREFDGYLANGSRPLVPPPVRERARRARSPTSAPSTGSTSRSGSTRAVSACWPATT